MEYCGGGSLQDIYHGKFYYIGLVINAFKYCARVKSISVFVFSDRTFVRASNSICVQRDLTGNCSFISYLK